MILGFFKWTLLFFGRALTKCARGFGQFYPGAAVSFCKYG